MDKDREARMQVAQDKLGLIAPVLNGTFPDVTKSAYYRRVAEQPITMADGTSVRVKASTIASWERRYRAGGFDALVPKARCDIGTSRKIDADLGADIDEMRAEHPKMGAQMVLDALVEQGYIAAGEISPSTMQRWFRRHPLPEGGESAAVKDRRAFEAARANDVWQADTLHGPHVGKPARRAYLQTIIDDKSRKIVASRFVAKDDAASFQGTLRAAVASHGIPAVLYVDNGGPYKNGQLAMICGNMGCALVHAPVRDGAAKGKIERLNRTVRMRFLSALSASAAESMESLNAALAAWVVKYNATVHSSTRKAPADSFAEDAASVRYVGGPDELDEAFRNSVTRVVSRDATVRLDGALYDAPMECIGQKRELRYTPGDPLDVWIVLEDGSRRRMAATDKQANAHAPRVKPTAFPIDFSAQGGE